MVAQNVWYREGEDLNKVANTLIYKALGMSDDIKIVRVLRKSGKNTRSGLIKIELDSENSVKAVLEQKAELGKSEVREIHEVFLQRSKPEETLVMERNIDLILRDMGVHDDYVRVSSGHLVNKSSLKGSTNGGARGGYACGGGR